LKTLIRRVQVQVQMNLGHLNSLNFTKFYQRRAYEVEGFERTSDTICKNRELKYTETVKNLKYVPT